MSIERYTIEELVTELRNRTTITPIEIPLTDRIFTYVMNSANNYTYDEHYEGTFSLVCSKINDPNDVGRFSIEAPRLQVSEVWTYQDTDSDCEPYTVVIASFI